MAELLKKALTPYSIPYPKLRFGRQGDGGYLGHIHGNNCGGIKDVPNTVECTYIRKDLLESVPRVETIPYPIDNLDFKNNVHEPDYPLRWWL